MLVLPHPFVAHGWAHVWRLAGAWRPWWPQKAATARLAHALWVIGFDEAAPDVHWPAGAHLLSPEEGIRRLCEPVEATVVVRSSQETASLIAWLKNFRRRCETSRPAVIALLPHDELASLNALRAGADAVLPLHASAELIAAQAARLRERATSRPTHLEGPGGLRLDAVSQRAFVGEQDLGLKPRLFKLLWCLLAEPARVFSLPRLREVVGTQSESQLAAIHAYMYHLRKSLRPHGLDPCIETVHRVGYRFEPDAAKPAPDAVTSMTAGMHQI